MAREYVFSLRERIASAGGTASLTVNEAALVSSAPVVTLLNQLTNGNLPSQTQQTVSIQISDQNDPYDLDRVQIVINNTFSFGYACQMYYFPAYNEFDFVVNNIMTPYTLGAAGQATGPHCILNTGASSAVYGPTGVTLNLALTLQPSAVGTQNIYVEAFDYDYGIANSTYYIGLAGWQAYALLTTAPPTVSMAPSPSPTSANSQVLQYEFSDGNGYTFITA